MDSIDMSLLKQEKKMLSFEEICPQWSRRIANYENLTTKEKQEIQNDLRNPSKCFVGEAHEFRGMNYYKCRECNCDFSGYATPNGLCHNFNSHKFGLKFDWAEFNRRKEAFVKHFNEVHVK
jgi:hypothetical protein